MRLSGWFQIVWGDPSEGTGESPILYMLQDGKGGAVRLDLSRLERGFDELIRMRGRRVWSRGYSQAPVRGQTETVIEATSIETVGELPLKPEAVSGNKRFISILCKFNDIAAEPKTWHFSRICTKPLSPGWTITGGSCPITSSTWRTAER